MPLDLSSEKQIREWIATGHVDALLSFIEVLKDQRDRAELQAQAYLHQMKIVAERTENIIKPLLEPKAKPSSTQQKPPTPKPTPKPKANSGLDLDIEL